MKAVRAQFDPYQIEEPAQRQKTLLVVDDEPQIIKSIVRSLKRQDIEILTAGSGPEGLDT